MYFFMRKKNKVNIFIYIFFSFIYFLKEQKIYTYYINNALKYRLKNFNNFIMSTNYTKIIEMAFPFNESIGPKIAWWKINEKWLKNYYPLRKYLIYDFLVNSKKLDIFLKYYTPNIFKYYFIKYNIFNRKQKILELIDNKLIHHNEASLLNNSLSLYFYYPPYQVYLDFIAINQRHVIETFFNKKCYAI